MRFCFFRVSFDQAKTKNDAETATCYLSLGENSPRGQAKIKERPTWRSLAGSRALYDQMAPQLCLFYISAKFDFRLTRQNLVFRPSDPRMRRTFVFSTLGPSDAPNFGFFDPRTLGCAELLVFRSFWVHLYCLTVPTTSAVFGLSPK